MMQYFKIKSVLTSDGQACKVEILEKLDPAQGKFGMEYPYNIRLDGKTELRWNASDNQVSKIDEVGEKIFWIKRWDKGGKTGFNFVLDGDITVQPQNLGKAISHAAIERKVVTQQDDYAVKVSRGASYNLAFQYCIENVHIEDLQEFLQVVAKKAEVIAVAQSNFVNGVKEDKVPDPTPPVEEEFKSDLPF